MIAASSSPRPPLPVLLAILAAYGALVVQMALTDYIFGVGFGCGPDTPVVVLPRLAAIVINLGLVTYVAVYGRWKVVWLTPQLLLLAYTLIVTVFWKFTGLPYMDTVDGRVCFTSVF